MADARRNEDPAATLHRLVNGYQVSQALHVAATLRLADRIADGVNGNDELAAATASHPATLYRLLRALAAVGVFVERDGRRFELTPVGEHLRSDAVSSSQAWAAFIGRPYYWEAWSRLGDSVRTGENAFRLTHGVGPWEFRSEHPEESAIFDHAMAGLTRRVSTAVIDAFDFGRFARIVDVGGGNGAFLADVLAACPDSTGVLLDQPHVVAGADTVLPPTRSEIVAGDFFAGVPAGGDAYVMKAILHDWMDPEAAQILATCRAAVGPEARLLVVERVLAGPNEGPDGKLSDLNMLVGPGGLERTPEEFAALLAATGFELVQVVATASPVSVLEARPA